MKVRMRNGAVYGYWSATGVETYDRMYVPFLCQRWAFRRGLCPPFCGCGCEDAGRDEQVLVEAPKWALSNVSAGYVSCSGTHGRPGLSGWVHPLHRTTTAIPPQNPHVSAEELTRLLIPWC